MQEGGRYEKEYMGEWCSCGEGKGRTVFLFYFNYIIFNILRGKKVNFDWLTV